MKEAEPSGVIHHPQAQKSRLVYGGHCHDTVSMLVNAASWLARELCNWQTSLIALKESLLSLYMHAIEMADSVDVLLSESCCTPAWLQVRSLFESSLSTEFMLAEDSEHRALAWQYFHLLQRLAYADRHDPSTERGKQWVRDVERDEVGSNLTPPPQELVERDVARFREALGSPRFETVRQEYREHRRRPRHWYALGGGPGNLRELAVALHHPAEYSALYSYWSEIGHAEFMPRSAKSALSGSGETCWIRNPSELQQVAMTAVNLLLSVSRHVSIRIETWEEFRVWYLESFRPKLLILTSCGASGERQQGE